MSFVIILQVTYVLHVDESGHYHVETTEGGVDETTIIETMEAAETGYDLETQTIAMHETDEGTVAEATLQDDQALEQIQEVSIVFNQIFYQCSHDNFELLPFLL